MAKVDEYRTTLRNLPAWEPFLLVNSGLPGPRANLELLAAVVEEGEAQWFLHYCDWGPIQAPGNSPAVFLCCCGVVGLGKLLADGQRQHLVVLRRLASDPRWRIREGVAMALQRWGDADMGVLLDEMEQWTVGNRLEQRAVVAAICEPRLLIGAEMGQRVLALLDRITGSIYRQPDSKCEEFTVLVKALSYGWSVAVATFPEAGKASLEKWLAVDDRVVRRIMRENLRKNRLRRLDWPWVEEWLARLESKI